MSERDDESIESLDISTRAYRGLMAKGITTVGDLLKMSDEDFLHIANFGRKSRNECKVVISELTGRQLDYKYEWVKH